jgi:hypothetical protein
MSRKLGRCRNHELLIACPSLPTDEKYKLSCKMSEQECLWQPVSDLATGSSLLELHLAPSY